MGKSKAKKTRKISVAKKTLSKDDPRLKVMSTTYQKEKEKQARAKKAREYEAKTGKKYRGDEEEKDTFDGAKIHHVEQGNANLFFSYNTNLGPPYRILIDTNFINFSIQNKLDLFTSLMDCLLAKCIPIITDCVMAELEKLGMQYRVALRIAKDPRIERYPCHHKGTYADDCLVNRVTQHRVRFPSEAAEEDDFLPNEEHICTWFLCMLRNTQSSYILHPTPFYCSHLIDLYSLLQCYIVATCDKDLKRRIRKIPGVPIMYITNRRYSIERFPDANDAPDK